MCDDEEVVLASSELHKYLEKSKIVGLNSSCHENYEFNSAGVAEDNHRNSSMIKTFEIPNVNTLFKKPELSSHTVDLIDTILKTALMYPDHVADIEIHVNIRDVKPKSFLFNNNTVPMFYSTFLLGSASFTFLCKKLNLLHLSIFVGSLYCSYKIYEDFCFFYQRKNIKRFTDVLERLFSIIKRALSFIFESEFVLKNKMLRVQPHFSPDNDCMNSNSTEGLKYSALLLPEFRAALGEVFVTVIFTFDNFIRYMRTYLCLLPHIDSDSNYTELPDINTLQRISTNPCLEDLKKLNSIFLIAQSEFLRRFILSIVKDFWMKSCSHNYLKILIEKVCNVTGSFLQHINILESFYKRYTQNNVNKYPLIERNKELKVRNDHDKLFIFARNFLTKADAHVLSLSLDLKVLDDLISEYEENNKENNGAILYDRLVFMKSNIDLYINLFIDNLNIFKNIVKNNSNELLDDTLKTEEKCTLFVKKTGIEVGRSDFKISGEDEVLISLCNKNVTNNHKTLDDDDDFEAGGSQKCLPATVLLELKSALQVKKEEWIKREKRVLETEGYFDKLDFDELSNSVTINNNDQCSSNFKKGNSRSKRHETVDSDHSDNEIDLLFNLKKNVSPSMCFNNNFISESISKTGSDNNNESKIDSNSSKALNSVDSGVSNNFNCSFVDQIKSAQKSFSLSLTEEEFVDGD